MGSALQVGQKWTTMMFSGSKVVISLCPQCLHTGVPHPEHEVSVWMPHEQASSFRAGSIEMPPFHALLISLVVMKVIAIFMPRGKAGAIRGLR